MCNFRSKLSWLACDCERGATNPGIMVRMVGNGTFGNILRGTYPPSGEAGHSEEQ